MSGRSKANGKNIFLDIFLCLERDTLEQMEFHYPAAYPCLTLMVLLSGNWVMENGYFHHQSQLILLVDYHC